MAPPSEAGECLSESGGPVSLTPSEKSGSDLTPIVAANLRRLRVKKGLSLERLARVSGVSRAMLGQIELAQSTPTINVLWKIARALEVPFATIMSNSENAAGPVVLPRERGKILSSHDGSFRSRALFPFEGKGKSEFYELSLAPGGVERAEPHRSGTTENLVVTEGTLDLRIDGTRFLLAAGDAIYFVADVPHEYRNPGDVPALMYLVMTYA